MVLVSGSGELAAEPVTSMSQSRPPQVRAAMHAMAMSYLAKKDGWFDEAALLPSNSALDERSSTAVRVYRFC